MLAQLRWRVARNSLWRRKRGAQVMLVVGLLVLGGAAYGLYWISRMTVRLLRSPSFNAALERAARETPGLPTDIGSYLEVLPSAVLLAATLLLALATFNGVLSSLYLAGDVDMLLVAPLPIRAVFIVKFFDALAAPYALLFALLGPFLFGYGQGMRFGTAFLLTAFVVLACLPLVPAGLGALLVMAAVRVMPAHRARELVGILGALLGAALYLVSQFTRELFGQIGGGRTLEALQRTDFPLLPSSWAGSALVAAGRGELVPLLLYGGVFVLVSAGVFGACLVAAERLYYAGWSNLATETGRVRRPPARSEAAVAGRVGAKGGLAKALSATLGGIPAPVRAMVAKDLRTFPRDLRHFQQLVIPLIMGGVGAYRLFVGDLETGGGTFTMVARLFAAVAPAALCVFIALIFSSALGGSGVNREGRGYWLVKTAPVSGTQIVASKLIVAYLPYPVVAVLLLTVTGLVRGLTLADVAGSLALVLLLGLGNSSLTLLLGVLFPRLDWDDPNKQVSTRAGCLAPLFYGSYLGLAFAAVTGLPALSYFAPQLEWLFVALGWLVVVGLTALVAVVALSVGSARLEALELE